MHTQEQPWCRRPGSLRASRKRTDAQNAEMSVLLKHPNSRPGVRGMLAIILACITVLALASCDYGGNNYSNDLGTAPGAETRHCVAAQVGQGGEQPIPTAVKPHPASPDEAMFGFDAQHTYYNPYEHILSPTNVSRLVLDWTATTAKPLLGMPWSSPTVANGMVYAASNDEKLYALNATTGAVLWSTCIGFATSSSPAVANGVVYIGSGGRLYALNATTGAVLWTADTISDAQIDSSPAVVKGVVYIGITGVPGGALYAFKADTGAKLWTVTTENYVQTSPAVANGVVYFVVGLGHLYAVSAATGALLWTAYTDTAHSSTSSPTVVNGVVYAGSGDGKLHAFNATTGAVIWTAATAGNDIDASPAVANGVVYIESSDGKLYAYNATTGASLWSTVINPRSTFRFSSPVVANGVVYVTARDGDNGRLYAVNASTGSMLWTTTPNPGIDVRIFAPDLNTPAVANGMVYVDSGDFKLFAYHLPG